jgi:hypothetical protein
MDPSPDELAGVVDLFGALTEAELCAACVELAHKAGEDRTPEAFEPQVAAAVESYHLVPVPDEGPDLLTAGPVAFPELPEGATDLPHILDVPERSVSTDRAAEAAQKRFRQAAATAVEAEDVATMRRLLDVSYELDVWGPVDLETTRERLDDALDGSKN